MSFDIQNPFESIMMQEPIIGFLEKNEAARNLVLDYIGHTEGEFSPALGIGTAAMLAPVINKLRYAGGSGHYDPATKKIVLPSKAKLIAQNPRLLFKPSQAQALRDLIEFHEKKEKLLHNPIKGITVSRRLLPKERLKSLARASLIAPVFPMMAAANALYALDPMRHTVGRHANLAVLAEESNKVLKDHSNTMAGGIMKKIRTDSREARLLKELTGKRYGIDKFTAADRLKLLKPVDYSGRGVKVKTRLRPSQVKSFSSLFGGLGLSSSRGGSLLGSLSKLLKKVRR